MGLDKGLKPFVWLNWVGWELGKKDFLPLYRRGPAPTTPDGDTAVPKPLAWLGFGI